MKSSLFYFIYPANSNSRENLGILARFRAFCRFLNSSSSVVSQAKQSKQLLTKEIRLLSEATMYIFPHRNR